MGGHRPETDFKFDQNLFYAWCNENNIVVEYYAKDRYYLLIYEGNIH